MSQKPLSELDRILQEQLRTLAATLKPGTIAYCRVQANRFLRYLHQNHPELQSPAPPLTNRSRRAALMCVRRLLDDLADNGYPVRDALILTQDFPPRDLYLPIPLSPEVDSLLNDELRRTDDLLSNALLLIRATGMRVGECLRLTRTSLRHLGGSQWALHVPLGKLHNERWVPVHQGDERRIFDRILSLVGPVPEQINDSTSYPLLLLPHGNRVSYARISDALKKAAKRAACSPARLHQLRHTYATVMLRAGISLTALKEIPGHRDIRMTMGYVQVTQKDLQRDYHSAREKIASVHTVPQLSPKHDSDAGSSRLTEICRVLDGVSHQLEMYRRQVSRQPAKHKLQSIARRLVKLRNALNAFHKA